MASRCPPLPCEPSALQAHRLGACLASALVISTIALGAGEAHAQPSTADSSLDLSSPAQLEPSSATAPEPSTEGYRSSDLWPGVTLVALGGGFVAGGVAALDAGQTGEELCFDSVGCTVRKDTRLTGAGVGMLTGGSTAVVFGLSTALTASSETSRERHSEPMAAMGQLLTGAGTATITGAIGALAYGAYEGDEMWLQGTLAAAGGAALIAAGVPLWIVGASSAESDRDRRTSAPQVAVGPGSFELRWPF